MLALRMGLPIVLLLITVLFLFAIPQILDSMEFKVVLLLFSLFTIVYYIFYLINQSATSTLIDPLTKAYNRENIFLQLQMMQKNTLLNSISLIRIKNISDLNDHFGYERVNALLAEFVKRLDLYLKTDKDLPIIGRLQGSDFVVGSILAPQDIKNSLLDFQQNNSEIEGIEIEIQSAVSVNTNDIVKNVEHLYDSLHQKLDKTDKNEIFIQDIKNLTKFEQEIVQAVNDGALIMSFKPVSELQNSCVDLYEAIIKLQTRSYGILPTAKYIPVINRLDLEQKFDLAIVRHISQILAQSDSLSISFNLSPFSLRSIEFANKFFDLIQEFNIAPSRYIIELYENKVYHDIDRYKQTLNRFKGYGVRLCLDNFGAMNASLEYIKYLPIDIVQFDNDFSKNLHNPSYNATLKAFIKLCDELHITTILKWIDKEEQMQIAKELEVDYIQGFYVGKLKNEKELV